MSGILRVYDPAECFPDGKPLDWERCSACDGCGHVHVVGGGDFTPAGYHGPEVCARCDGHGSLKAAAQFTKALRVPQAGHGPCGGTGLLREVWPQADGSGAIGDQCHCVALELRCEDCGHPMSEGAWEGLPDYSPCDDGCRHGGYALVRDGGSSYMSRESTADDHAAQRRSEPDTPLLASWRAVDVRTLGWPHDLRPEKLAVLCLRCLAARQRA